MLETKPPYSLKRTQESAPATETLDSGVYPYLHVLRNRKSLLFGSIIGCLFIAFIANLTQKPVYQASVEVLLESKEAKTAPNSSGFMNIPFMQDPTLMLTQFRLIRSPHLAEWVLKKLENPENRNLLLECFAVRPSRARKSTEVFSSKERAFLLARIQGSLSARQPDRSVRIITISAMGYRPEMVAKVANAAAEAYIEMNHKSNIDSFRQSFLMISQSLAEIREKIKAGELAFQKIDSEVRLLEALKIYGERHPLVVQLRSDIPQLTEKIKFEIQNLETTEVGQRKDLAPLLTTYRTSLDELQKVERDLYILKPLLEQEVSSQKEMYNSIFKKLQGVEVSGGGSVWVDAEVVEPASVPSDPIRPNKKLNLTIGFFVGLFIGVGLAFFLEYLDSSIRSLDDVRSYLRLFPLGMVPHVGFAGGRESRVVKEGESPAIIRERSFWLAGDTDVPLYVAEAYRIIRTNLGFGSVDSDLRVIQVTSSVKGEGKTTTAANIAVSLALAGSRTLLVDADLRRPCLHRILGMEGIENGLSNTLSNGHSWESAVVPTTTPNLYLLPAGTIPPNPSELLSSKRMRALIDELRENFEMVVLDSPPVISVADAAIIASRTDGTIFVSRAGFVPRHLCQQAKHSLESVNGKIIGCVLNDVQTEQQPYYYHQYALQYGRYHDDGDQESNGQEKLSSQLTTTVEKIQVLKEPFFIFLSSMWTRLGEWMKWNEKKESKTPVGAP